MTYLIPFSQIKRRVKVISSKGQLKVDLNYDEFIEIVRQLLSAVHVDEKYYCDTYPDVAEAINEGVHENATRHFAENGYYEGRRPFKMLVDEGWYLEQNPDVKAGIVTGEFKSAQDHFVRHGYDEGRRPCPA